MKTKFHSLLIILTCLAGIHQAAAQGTAFTYQGRLNAGGAPAGGNFDFQFNLFADAGGTQPVGGAFSTNNIPVSGGLFTTTLDFGAGIFTGSNYFLQISVRTNTGGTGMFTALTPLQPLTPTPYAIMANSASNLLGKLATAQLNGTVGNTQLANNSITVNPGAGLSGGGAVALGGTTTLNNTGVLSVTGGSSDITANTVSGVATLGSDATSAATASTLVKRDGTGSFSAGAITATSFSGNGLALTDLNASQLISIGNNFPATGNFFVGTVGNNGSAGQFNTGVGQNALQAITGGSNDTAYGFNTLHFNFAGSDNTAIGYDALHGNTSGSENTAVGSQALGNTTSSSNNIALGYLAGGNITTGNSNIDIGNIGIAADTSIIRIGSGQTQTYIAGVINGNGGGLTNLSGLQVTSIGNTNGGGDNSFIGSAGNSTTSGSANTATGTDALHVNTTGYDNVAVGFEALVLNTSGNNNTAIGEGALNLNTTGSDNTAIGNGALFGNTIGNNNTAIGLYALVNLGVNNEDGADNIALGFNAGSAMTANESSNIDIGNPGVSGDNNTIRIGSAQTNTFIAGTISGNGGGLTNLSGLQLTSIGNTNIGSSGNFFIGPSGNSTTTGQGNTGSGLSALASDTSGSDNTATGLSVLHANTTGSANTAVGSGALYLNTVGNDNTAIGEDALIENISGYNNTAIGQSTLFENITGADNTAIGENALFFNEGGGNNTAIGYGALYNLGVNNEGGGADNIALGLNAGLALNGNESSNIDIGNPGVSGDNNIIRIGASQTQTYIAGTNFFSKPVAIVSTAPEGLLEIQGGADNTGANDQKDIALAYHSGGYRHWIRSRHNTAAVDNAIDFFVNNSSSSTASSAPGTGNVLVMTLNGGNVGIGNAEPTHLLVVSSNSSPAYCDGTTWQNGSDRNSKEAFAAIDSGAVLEKVSALPITEWKYKVEADGTKHIGPMAQDFHAAFGLNGGDEKHIATIDEEGVALAAIQGLNQKLENEAKEKNVRIQTLERENESLAARLNELEATVNQLAARK